MCSLSTQVGSPGSINTSTFHRPNQILTEFSRVRWRPGLAILVDPRPFTNSLPTLVNSLWVPLVDCVSDSPGASRQHILVEVSIRSGLAVVWFGLEWSEWSGSEAV